MSFLDPIFYNKTGTIYALKSTYDIDEPINKVQLQIGDIAILMQKEEIRAFLNTVKKAKDSKSCECLNCNNSCKIIKCDTPMANIRLKMTEENLNDLEELVMSLFFQEKINSILTENNIENLNNTL